MSDFKCPMKPSLRLDNEHEIRDAVEAMVSSKQAENASDALRTLLKRGVAMTNNDSEIITLNLKYQVHTIALLQRLVGMSDEQLIGLAREDAASMFEQIMANVGEK